MSLQFTEEYHQQNKDFMRYLASQSDVVKRFLRFELRIFNLQTKKEYEHNLAKSPIKIEFNEHESPKMTSYGDVTLIFVELEANKFLLRVIY